jgi:hypothetical protein
MSDDDAGPEPAAAATAQPDPAHDAPPTPEPATGDLLPAARPPNGETYAPEREANAHPPAPETEHPSDGDDRPAMAASSGRLSDEQRRAILDEAIGFRVAGSPHVRVEKRTPFEAVIAEGKPVNHLLHLVLTLLTGVWAVVWVLAVVRGAPRRWRISVDEIGLVSARPL